MSQTSTLHPPDAGAFELVDHPPGALLHGLVSRMVGYRETLLGHSRQREAASITVPLIISFGTPFAIGLGRTPTAADTISSFTSGLFAGPVFIDSFGAAHCLQIDFTPLGARRFFGLPMHELAERMVALDDVLGHEGHALRERLDNLKDWPSRFVLAERFLTTRFSRSIAALPEIRMAMAHIQDRGGQVTVSRLARMAGWTRKHLADRFRREIGIAPKAVARIVRLNQAMREARSTEAGWADIAAGCGFADQAHLTREFQVLAGTSPSAWRAGLS